jgi:hypothetical protein
MEVRKCKEQLENMQNGISVYSLSCCFYEHEAGTSACCLVYTVFFCLVYCSTLRWGQYVPPKEVS